MRGAVVREFGGHENVRVEDGLPIPTIGEKQVGLIKINTFMIF